ncbi:MAG TPA: hypothetical protein VJN43_13540 [Bryobacteraceae bacterium]|nr:hypothetical protein [Bryobacteraceae bacterium]
MGTAGAVLAVVAWYAAAHAQDPDIIMARVAANQDRAQQMRSLFVYRQSMLIRCKRSGGKLAREEQREYTVTPSDKGFTKTLDHFTGKYEKGGKFFEYDKPGYHYKGVDIDSDLADSLAKDLADDKNARDGVSRSLFPLTAAQQKKFVFHLEGKEDYRSAQVYRITFTPKQLSLLDCDDDGESTCWAGEALIDTREFQPVLITSWLAKDLPRAVRVLLGTSFTHVGFKVSYKKFEDGLWFPVTYGGEFRVRGLFLYKRTFAISVINSGFQRSEVTSTVRFEKPAGLPD